MTEREHQQFDEVAKLFADILFGILWAMVIATTVALVCIKMSGPAL